MSRRFESLDSLRGFAACIVALGHLWTSNPLTFTPFLRNAGLCVDFFFVLSGFVISWNYQGRLTSWRAAARFGLLRLGRVYPLHVVTLLAMLALVCVQQRFYPFLLAEPAFGPNTPVPAFFSNLFLVQSLNLHERATWNVPAWSISTEVWAYAFFALASVLAPRRALFIFVLAIPVCTLMLSFTPMGMQSIHDWGMLRCLLGFCTGIAACALYRRVRYTTGTVAECCGVAAVLALMLLGSGNALFLAPVVMGAAVLVFARDEGLVSRCLARGPFPFLGRISYSIYMTHWLVMAGFYIATNQLRNVLGIDLWGRFHAGISAHLFGRTPVEGVLFHAVFLLAVIALSTLTYRFIEQPAREWSRRRQPLALPAHAAA